MNWSCPTCFKNHDHPARRAEDVPPELTCDQCGGTFATEVDHWVPGSASPKQRAFLEFVGFNLPANLTADQAAHLIENMDTDGDWITREFRQKRCRLWHSEKYFAHPELYGDEFVKGDLPRLMHAFIRERVIGAEGRLTTAKVKAVIDDLNRRQPGWWVHRNRGSVFMNNLGLLFPECLARR